MTDAPQSTRADDGAKPLRLRDALRHARLDAAGRTGVVVDLRDAEMARLEILNESLDPLFADIPDTIDMFDRGISHGDPPRLWVDVIAHVQMGRDKRTYRFVQDTRYGRTLLAESSDATTMANAVADYVARRMIERELALAGRTPASPAMLAPSRKQRGRLLSFVAGLLIGAGGLLLVAMVAAMRSF